MSIAAPTPVLTTADLFTLPDDGIDRYFIRGQLRERVMTKRNRWHSQILAQISHLLKYWSLQQPEPRGAVFAGEVGVRLRRDPDTTVGIDVAYVSAEVLAQTPEDSPWIEGAPVLAVEILSPSNLHEEIVEKIREYLDAGVSVVWIVDPDFETVRVHRRGVPPVLFTTADELTAEPFLPGFRVRVADIFQQ